MKKENYYYLLQHLATLQGVGIFCMDGHELHSMQESSDGNPIQYSAQLQRLLQNGADGQREPYIYRDKYQVVFACIRRDHSYYMIGPMSLELLERMELRQFFQTYGVDIIHEKRLRHFSLAEILDMVEILAKVLLDREYSDKELLLANQNVADETEKEDREYILFEKNKEEESIYHHTYMEEKKLLDSVREGCMEEALYQCRNMDADLGKLSKKELNHWKNVAIVAITLCTRAAIDGGVSPFVAYQISDFYIQKSDSCTDIVQTIQYRDRAVEELVRQVQKKKSRKTSNYIERSKDYIDQNYRSKIYLSDIAESIGLSEAYLSRLFRRETGIRLQDYIVEVRLDHAKNLLKYSEETLSHIAEYVNFPSQSYMGRVFQKKCGMSPKKYRETNRPTEYYKRK